MIIFVSNNFNHIKKLMSIPNIKNNLLITSSFENAFLWSKFKKIELIIFDVNINLNLLQKQNIAYINYFDFLNKIKNLSLQNENKKIENKEISQEKKEIQFPSKSNKSNYEKLSCVKTKDNIQENTTPIPVNKLSLKCRNIITITSVKGGVNNKKNKESEKDPYKFEIVLDDKQLTKQELIIEDTNKILFLTKNYVDSYNKFDSDLYVKCFNPKKINEKNEKKIFKEDVWNQYTKYHINKIKIENQSDTVATVSVELEISKRYSELDDIKERIENRTLNLIKGKNNKWYIDSIKVQLVKNL